MAAGQGMVREADAIFAESQKQVPMREGILAGSGQVFDPAIVGNEMIVEIGYGDQAQAYAAVQHERTDYRHDAGRKSHYLQDPFEDALNGMADRLASQIGKALGGF